MAQMAIINKNQILSKEIASGYVTFATGATAATLMTASVSAYAYPSRYHILSIKNVATQTKISVELYTKRSFGGSAIGVPISTALYTTASYNTGQARDVLVEGLFAAGASALDIVFSLGTALTAAETFSPIYQVHEYI